MSLSNTPRQPTKTNRINKGVRLSAKSLPYRRGNVGWRPSHLYKTIELCSVMANTSPLHGDNAVQIRHGPDYFRKIKI